MRFPIHEEIYPTSLFGSRVDKFYTVKNDVDMRFPMSEEIYPSSLFESRVDKFFIQRRGPSFMNADISSRTLGNLLTPIWI